MKIIRDWSIRSKIIVALIMVTLLTSMMGIIVFRMMLVDIAQRILPQERLVSNMQYLTVQILQEYKSFALIPKKDPSDKIGQLLSEITNSKKQFSKSSIPETYKFGLLDELDNLQYTLLQDGNRIVEMRQQQIEKLHEVDKLEERLDTLLGNPFTTSIPAEKTTLKPDLSFMPLAQKYIYQIRAYALLQSDETKSALNKIQYQLTSMSVIMSEQTPSFTKTVQKPEISNLEPQELLMRLLTLGKETVDTTNIYHDALIQLETTEKYLLNQFMTKMNLISSNTNDILYKNFYILLVMIISIIFITSVLGYMLSEYLLQPLRKITFTAEKYGEGQFNERINLPGTDEIAELANTFNRMANRLQSNFLEREFAEKTLCGLNEELKAKSSTLALAAHDLREARDIACAADRAKSEFLATMSHELRTPLNAIIGFSELILRETFGPETNVRYQEYIRDINGSGEILLGLINDILDLSKIESGQEELHEEYLDIEEVGQSVTRLVRQKAMNHNLAVESDFDEDLPLLFGDSRKMKQIFMNLISNAIKFTLAGGRITFTGHCDANGDMIIRVSDTGIGIALEDIPKAFSRFVQIDSGLNRKHLGTGLGLPLTKGLVELHGGTLLLTSIPGEGTSVTLTFPAKRCFHPNIINHPHKMCAPKNKKPAQS